MGQLQDSINSALAEGYSRAEIMNHIIGKPKYAQQIKQAKAVGGFSDEEIFGHLFGEQKKPPQPKQDINSIEHKARRIELGLPATMKPGQGAERAKRLQQQQKNIGTGSAFYQGMGESMGIESQPEARQQHQLATDAGGIVGLIAQLGTSFAPVGSAANAASAGITKQVGRAALTGALIGGGQQAPLSLAELGAFGGGATKKPLQAITDVAKMAGLGATMAGVPVAGGLAVQKLIPRLMSKTPQPTTPQGSPELANAIREMNEEIAARTGRTSSGWGSPVQIPETISYNKPQPPRSMAKKPNEGQVGAISEPVTIRGAQNNLLDNLVTTKSDVKRVDSLFDKLANDIGTIAAKGTSSPDLRAEVGKGIAANRGSLVSQSVVDETRKEFVQAIGEMQRLRGVAINEGDKIAELSIAQAETRARLLAAKWNEAKRTSHESLAAFQRTPETIDELGQIQGFLQSIGEIKQAKPLYDRAIGQFKNKQYVDAAKTMFEAQRLNLFPLTSGFRDFVTNTLVLAARVPGEIAYDLATPGNKFARTLGIINSIRSEVPQALGQKINPNIKRYELPKDIESAITGTAYGEPIPQNRNIFTDAKIGGVSVDPVLSAGVNIKIKTDNLFSRIGALSELIAQGNMAARKAGLKGQESKSFVSDFVANPPDFAKMEAIRLGKDASFKKQLTPLEDAISNSFMVKAFLAAFPRWMFNFGRWAAETLGTSPTFWGKIKANTASSGDIARYLTTAATGWGGVKFVNDVLYENVDPVRMELRNANGDRVRFGGLSPLPDAYILAALMRGDIEKARAAAQYTSLPGLNVLGAKPQGMFSDLAMSIYRGYTENPKTTTNSVAANLVNTVNTAIPGRAVLMALKTVTDQTQREGIGAEVPGISYMLPPKINPTTGAPLRPQQLLGAQEFPAIGGLSVPGGVRSLNPIEKTLLDHGFGTAKPRRGSILDFQSSDVPKPLRLKYEELSGKNVNQFVGQLINTDEFKTAPFDARRKMLQKVLDVSHKAAIGTLASDYGTYKKPEGQRPGSVRLLPESVLR